MTSVGSLVCSVPAGGWADRAVIAPGGQQGFLRPTSGRQVESIWVMDSKVLLESLPTPKIELLALLRAGVRVIRLGSGSGLG